MQQESRLLASGLRPDANFSKQATSDPLRRNSISLEPSTFLAPPAYSLPLSPTRRSQDLIVLGLLDPVAPRTHRAQSSKLPSSRHPDLACRQGERGGAGLCFMVGIEARGKCSGFCKKGLGVRSSQFTCNKGSEEGGDKWDQ